MNVMIYILGVTLNCSKIESMHQQQSSCRVSMVNDIIRINNVDCREILQKCSEAFERKIPQIREGKEPKGSADR